MRVILAIAATSFVLVGCNSLGSSAGSSASSPPADNSCTPQTIVTKTGVVETCV